MKKKLTKGIGTLMITAIIMACGGGDDSGGGSTPSGGQASNKLLEAPTSVELLPEGETKTMTITARNCSWTIEKESAASWLTVTPLSGNGTQSITLTASKNETNNRRQATLTIKEDGGQITRYTTVMQDYDRPDPNEGIPQADDNNPVTPPQ